LLLVVQKQPDEKSLYIRMLELAQVALLDDSVTYSQSCSNSIERYFFDADRLVVHG